MARGEFSQALGITTQLTQLEAGSEGNFGSASEGSVEPEILVKALLTETEALAGGNNLGGALSTLVKAVNLARSFHMAYLAALGQLHMACVQVRFSS